MSIDSVSKTTPSLLAADTSSFQKARADFQALSSALNSKDLTGAKQDFASLEKDAPELASAVANSPGASGTTALDSFKALASSLQSNDLAGAQNAMNALQNNVSSQATLHHGHHHHRAYTDNAAAAQLSGITAPVPAASGSSLNASA